MHERSGKRRRSGCPAARRASTAAADDASQDAGRAGGRIAACEGREAYSGSREARQRKKARRCRLGVRGFVRLSIVQPLALGPAQQSFGPIRVIESERSPVVLLEVCFGKVAVQMRFADVMIDSEDPTLED